jgi:predicted permease
MLRIIKLERSGLMLAAYLNIFSIFALMFVGYFITYKGWLSDRSADVFSKIVLNIALPFNMFLNINQNLNRGEFLHLFSGMIIPILSMSITFFISLIFAKLMGVEEGRRGTFSTMFTCSNTIFIGLPINLAIFGEVAVPYVLLYYIINTTFFWTIGVFKIAQDSPHYDANHHASFHPLSAIKKILNPALMGFIIGLIWIMIKIPVPSFLANFAGYLGGLTTPLSMFFVGNLVYFIGVKNLKINKDIVGVMIGRFIISPLIVWTLTRFIHVPDMMYKVFLIQSAMPIQNSVPILTHMYEGDNEFATGTLGFTTLSYMVVIPVFLMIIF